MNIDVSCAKHTKHTVKKVLAPISMVSVYHGDCGYCS